MMTISTEKQIKIRSMYRSGRRLKEICCAANVCKETIRKYRRLAGISGRYRVIERQKWEKDLSRDCNER